MTDELAIRLARVHAMAISASIKCAAMQAENAKRALDGEAQAYGESAFYNLLDEHGLHWNHIVGETRP